MDNIMLTKQIICRWGELGISSVLFGDSMGRVVRTCLTILIYNYIHVQNPAVRVHPVHWQCLICIRFRVKLTGDYPLSEQRRTTPHDELFN